MSFMLLSLPEPASRKVSEACNRSFYPIAEYDNLPVTAERRSIPEMKGP